MKKTCEHQWQEVLIDHDWKEGELIRYIDKYCPFCGEKIEIERKERGFLDV